MTAVILCGGYGTRIRDVNELIPKPMLPIGGKPILWHIMKIFSMHGVNKFILCLGYKGWIIKEFFLNYRSMVSDLTVTLGQHANVSFHNHIEEAPWEVTLAETGENTMNGSRIPKIRHYLENEDHFFVTYGDGVSTVDLSKLLDHHKKSGLAATLTSVQAAGRFGEVDSVRGVVTKYHEKPAITAGRINGGFMVFDQKRIWDYFPPHENVNLESEPLQHLMKDNQLGDYQHDGYWQCMDNLREYNLLNAMWDENRAPWKLW